MDWYTGPEGDQRIWYEASEIDDLMTEQVRRAGQRLTLQSPAPDLEAFVEQHLGVELDQYANLPDEVLGLTQFSAPITMMINASLTERADEIPPMSGARGRWRATIAHEAAHVVLHRYLFDPQMAKIKSGDFRDPVSGTGNEAETLFRVRCLHRDVKAEASAGSRSRRDWREVQANKGMAALLMPRSIFKRVAVMNGAYEDSGIMTESASGKGLLDAIATAFDVSRQAAEYRMREFAYLS